MYLKAHLGCTLTCAIDMGCDMHVACRVLLRFSYAVLCAIACNAVYGGLWLSYAVPRALTYVVLRGAVPWCGAPCSMHFVLRGVRARCTARCAPRRCAPRCIVRCVLRCVIRCVLDAMCVCCSVVDCNAGRPRCGICCVCWLRVVCRALCAAVC